MSLKNSATKIIVFLLFLPFSVAIAQTSKYPNVDKTYSKIQLDSMIELFQKENDTLGLAFTYWTYGKNQEKSSELNESPLINFRKSMECFQKLRDSSHYYMIRGGIGFYFMYRPFLKQFAKEYIESSVNYFRKEKRYNDEIWPLINLANVYIYDNDFITAKKILERGELLNKIVKNKTYEGQVNASYSDLYSRDHQYQKALEYAQAGLQIANQQKVEWLKAVCLYYSARCFEGLKKYDMMLPVLLESKKITEANVNLIQLRKEVYENLRNYYYYKKDYLKGYEYAVKVSKTIETFSFSKSESNVRLSNEYKLLEEQKAMISKNILEKKLVRIELEKLKTRQQFYILILTLSIIICLLFTYNFINKNRVNKLNVIQRKKNLQITALNALINGQELERVRVAQELHDGLGTMLSRMKISIESGAVTEKISQMIDELCSEVRTISDNLQPDTLTNFGLEMAIQDLVAKQNSSKTKIFFQYFGNSFKIQDKKELMIYRIIQELLTNSLKHAKASEILIQIIFSEDKNISLIVEDDGIGFDEKLIKADSHGWKNIQSRVKYLNGSINLYIENGTSVNIIIPFASEKDYRA